jgi:hypothetical protein
MGNRWPRLTWSLAPVAVLALVIAACGSRADHDRLFAEAEARAKAARAPAAATTTTVAIDPEAAKTEVKTLYETGLNGPNLKDTATTATRIESPDDPQVKAIIEAVATRPLFANVAGKIANVNVLDAEACEEATGQKGCAEAELDIYLNASDASPALPKYKVYAVRVDNQWKVANATLCGLVKLDPTLPQCAE